jgi:Ser/Thr protein kinase RdoA (MazF antagonist)
MDDNIAAALARIPVFDGVPRETIACARLGGLTNLVYRVDAGDRRYLLRIAGEGREDYIDRKVEGHNARVAAEA